MIELTPEIALKMTDEIVAKIAIELKRGSKTGQIRTEQIGNEAGSAALQTGRMLGEATAALQAGYAEGYEAYMKAHGLDDEGRKLTGGAKPLSDCADCQCNYCERLEACQRHREGAARKEGDVTPWPCVGCEKGSTFISCGNGEPDCPDWEEMDGTNYT